MTDDLVALANRLTNASPGKPRQADLRRAVSTAYYAQFHAVAKNVADIMAGGAKGNRSEQAWAQACRGLQHGDAKAACEAIRNQNVSQEIKDRADAFIVSVPSVKCGVSRADFSSLKQRGQRDQR